MARGISVRIIDKHHGCYRGHRRTSILAEFGVVDHIIPLSLLALRSLDIGRSLLGSAKEIVLTPKKTGLRRVWRGCSATY